MARLPYADPERVPERVREALEAVPPLNVFRMTANAETAFRPWLAFGGALLSSLELDPRVRELVILRVARLCGSEYEWVQHVPIARSAGATGEQVAAVDRGDLDNGALGEGDRAVLRFTTEVVRDVRASDEALAAVVDAGLSPREVVELLLVIGQYMLVARMADGTSLAADVYYPTDRRTGREAPGRFPVVLSITPYGKRSSVTKGSSGSGFGGDGYYPYLVQRGYLNVVVDVRGTGASGGRFGLFDARERRDGVELARWAARLPGSSGRVGIAGCSYLGLNQIFTAADAGRGSAAPATPPRPPGLHRPWGPA